MRRNTLALLISLSVFSLLISCKEEMFPEVKNLTEYPNTTFTAYTEKIEESDKNVVYAASFLFAWDEIRKSLKNNISIDESRYKDLYSMNLSDFHKNSLLKSEYRSSVKISGNRIIAEAEFKKTLSFEREFKSFDKNLLFNCDSVNSFGTWGNDYWCSFMVDVFHYKNSDDFIVKLFPKNDEHEIILYKPDTIKEIKLSSIWNDAREKINAGIRDKVERRAWRYKFEDDEMLEVPKIKFNIETNYSEYENAELVSSQNDYIITKAYQRTAFILNEKGAVVESISEIENLIAPLLGLERPEPKELIFDSPFLIVLKRVDSKNPYFMMWVANTELMEK